MDAIRPHSHPLKGRQSVHQCLVLCHEAGHGLCLGGWGVGVEGRGQQQACRQAGVWVGIVLFHKTGHSLFLGEGGEEWQKTNSRQAGSRVRGRPV